MYYTRMAKICAYIQAIFVSTTSRLVILVAPEERGLGESPRLVLLQRAPEVLSSKAVDTLGRFSVGVWVEGLIFSIPLIQVACLSL